MTELSVGALFGTVELTTVSFDRGYARVVKAMSELGARAERMAGQTATVDESLASVGGAADKAAAGLTRAGKASATTAADEQKAAVAATKHAEAIVRVNAIMNEYAGASARVQQAALRVAAAEERLSGVQTTATASTRQLASAQAGLIGAQQSLARAQQAGVVSGGRFRESMASTAKMAGSLGLAFGVFEIIKQAIDVTKQAGEFQRAMVQVQTNADVTAGEVNKASSALLKMAGPVAAAPAELAVAWYHAKSVGLDYAKSIETTRIAAEGARVGNADLEETMNALTSTVASGIPGVEDMSKAMGQLIAIVGSGDMKLPDLNEFLGSGILTRMKQYGLTLTDVGAAAATLGDNNIRGADAATLLRMSVEAMVKQGKPGQEALSKIGLRVNQLRDDIQKGGLNKALLDLNAHLKTAGITGDKVGSFLLDAFTKKGGGGVSILLGQLDRLESKYAVLTSAGDSFDEKWKTTTKTASFQFAALGSRLEAAGIVLTSKLNPALASSAHFLSTDVPNALAATQHAVGPLGHAVGDVLVGSWHALVAVLGPAAHALGTTAGFLGRTGVVTDMAEAVLTLWLAFKGYTIAVAALKAVQTAIVLTRVRLIELREAGMLGAAGLAAFAVAAYAGGKALSSYLERNNSTAKIADNFGHSVDGLTASLVNHRGETKAVTTEWIHAQLEATGLATKLGTAGITVDQATDALLNGKDATLGLVDSWKQFGKPSADSITALGLISTGVDNANAKAIKLAQSTDSVATATSDLSDGLAQTYNEQVPAAARAADKLSASAQITTINTNGLKIALGQAALKGKDLADALNNIDGGSIATAQALIAFKQSAHGLGAQFDKNNKSIVGNSAAALQNRSALLSVVDAAKQHADAMVAQGKKAKDVSAALSGDIRSLVDQAVAAGGSRKEIDRLLRSMGLMPKQINTALHLTGADLAAQALKRVHDAIAALHNKTIDITTYERVVGITGKNGTANQMRDPHPTYTGSGTGGLPDGWSSAGERGTELIHKSGSHVDIYSHAQSRAIAAATGMKVEGFAGGTAAAAAKAAAHQTTQTAVTDASGAITNVSTNKTSFTFLTFVKQMREASIALAAAIRAGASKSQIAGLTNRLDRAEARGSKLERGLGGSIHREGVVLGRSVDQSVTVGKDGKLHGAVVGAADIGDQLHQMETNLRSAGFSSKFIAGLHNENKQIIADAAARNSAARHLAVANKAVVAAQTILRNDRSAFKGVVVDSFDITSAGTNDKGIQTKGGLRAEQKQDITRARAFLTGMTTLTNKKIFPTAYLRALFGKGPDALGTVQALLSMRAPELRAFARGERSLDSLGNQIGSLGATRLDQGAVDTALANQHTWERREATRQKHLDKALDHFANRISDKLDHLHLTAALGMTKGQLAVLIKTGDNQNAKAERR
jgi:TP901 family phage tail tape measure protein